jgi:6,7-dimethyl-8-ribityllumazine synthase
MSTRVPVCLPVKIPRNARIAIVASRFNNDIVEELLDGCLDRLKSLGLPVRRIILHRVPGAFELPLAAKALAKTRKFSAIICLGCVIRGQTPHFDYVAGQCARGLQNVALQQMLPVIFGVLTTNTEKQARDRAGGKHGHAGIRAADSAAEMIALLRSLRA